LILCGGYYKLDRLLRDECVTDCEPTGVQRWLISKVPGLHLVQASELVVRQPCLAQEV